MFEAIKDAALHLRRGDSLTIIPITGDAEANLQGEILHYEVPPLEMREAYDGDLQKMITQITSDLSRLSTEAATHPGTYTDILGSIRVALMTFSAKPTEKRLIILSDFIQDEDQFKFGTDLRLGSEDSAVSLACVLNKKTKVPSSIRSVLGRLKSNEFDRLPIKRRLAINTFCEPMFNSSSIAPDGTYALESVVNRD